MSDIPIKTGAFPTTVAVYILEDDRATISRSKLEHLKDMSEDERLNEPSLSIESFLSVISQGLFFTSLGG